MLENWNLCSLLLEWKLMWPLWKSVQKFLKKLNVELTYNPAISFMSIYQKELKAESQTSICMPVFIAPLFIIAKRWKQPKCLLADDWISKMWCIYAMGHYQTLKRREILAHASTQMNSEDVMLSEISQSQKNKCCLIPILWCTWSSQIHRDWKQNGGCQGQRLEKGWEVLFKRYRVLVLEDEKSWSWMVMIEQQCECT